MVQDRSGDQQPNPPKNDNPLQALIEQVRSGQLPLPLLGGIAAVVVVGIILVVVALGSGGGDDNGGSTATRPTAESGGLQTSRPTPAATIDLARPTAQPAGHWTDVGPDFKFVISKFGIEAPLTYRKVPPTGVMPNPEGPDDVAYYDFSDFEHFGGAPGLGGNSIFAGHVDSGSKACQNGTVPPPCEAVLWDLNLLDVGDIIEIHANGEVYQYEVQTNEPVSASLGDGTWDQIVSSTEEETLTIITCGGDFNRETHEYNNRQVVTATRVTTTASSEVTQ
jgi:LPXTG-site transpeptidase (sortase) family protein